MWEVERLFDMFQGIRSGPSMPCSSGLPSRTGLILGLTDVQEVMFRFERVQRPFSEWLSPGALFIGYQQGRQLTLVFPLFRISGAGRRLARVGGWSHRPIASVNGLSQFLLSG